MLFVAHHLRLLAMLRKLFLGTCCSFRAHFNAPDSTRILYKANIGRCANGYLINRPCATKVMEVGAIADEYVPIDLLMNRYIKKLQL
jgi:hypothetical protein